MMRRAVGAVLLFLTLFLIWPAKGTQPGPPGKPELTRCRTPDKETFTCWWNPGLDGGLPTTYALYFRKENSDKIYECPDYSTAGGNSCFFNKNNTSTWITYNITVVATNALGSTSSDPVDIDVVYIVQPHRPENVKVQLKGDIDGPFLRVSWEPPHKADTRSGWITLVYELRVRLDGEEEWEEHPAGHQKMFNIFSLRPGGLYLVQVRCKPDHGFWSEWSAAAYIEVPDYIPQGRSMWTLIMVFSSFIILILTWILILKCHRVKNCLLPPVPGPKIKGFDEQLLKSGSSDEAFISLAVPGFPPTSSDREDLLVEYLEVCACEEQELAPDEGKDGPGASRSDGDSGRGSCDSHTLLLEKSGEARGPVEEEEEEEQRLAQAGLRGPDASAWPSVFPPPPHYTSLTLDPWGSPEQLCPSSSPAQLGYSTKEDLAAGAGCWEPRHARQQAVQPYWAAPSLPGGWESKPARASADYVEVQRVHQGDVVVLQRLLPDRGGREEYSRVKGVDGCSVLLAPTEEGEGGGAGGGTMDAEGRGGEEEYCYAVSCQAGDAVLTGGYVDTAAMLPRCS